MPSALGKCPFVPWQPILGIRNVGDLLTGPQVCTKEVVELQLTPEPVLAKKAVVPSACHGCAVAASRPLEFLLPSLKPTKFWTCLLLAFPRLPG